MLIKTHISCCCFAAQACRCGDDFHHGYESWADDRANEVRLKIGLQTLTEYAYTDGPYQYASFAQSRGGPSIPSQDRRFNRGRCCNCFESQQDSHCPPWPMRFVVLLPVRTLDCRPWPHFSLRHTQTHISIRRAWCSSLRPTIMQTSPVLQSIHRSVSQIHAFNRSLNNQETNTKSVLLTALRKGNPHQNTVSTSSFPY
jgi:hypothetical protein